MTKTLRPILVSLVGLALLAACNSAEPADPGPVLKSYPVESLVDGQGTAFGVAFILIEFGVPLSWEGTLETRAAATLATSSVVEIENGMHVGMLADIDASGRTTFTLPPTEDIPPSTVTNATQAFLNVNSSSDCSVDVSPPSARMSITAFSDVGRPGFFALTSQQTLTPAVLSNRFYDLQSLDSYLTYQWIYSDAEAELSFSGSGCGWYVASGVTFEKGWNMLGWQVNSTSRELINVEEPETIYMTIIPPSEVTGR